MKISDLRPGMRNINIEGRVVEISEQKEVVTRFGLKRIANATLEDETGSVTLALWEEQIDTVSEGDTIQIIDGFTRIFRGKLQLSVPKRGRIIVK